VRASTTVATIVAARESLTFTVVVLPRVTLTPPIVAVL
jgi:hypothetical protein